MWGKLLMQGCWLKPFTRSMFRMVKPPLSGSDCWTEMGRLTDLTGSRWYIDLGTSATATVGDVMRNNRRRRHGVPLLNEIEDEIDQKRQGWSEMRDVQLWKHNQNKYMSKFSSKNTWYQLREVSVQCAWGAGVWFTHATPKYAFLMWLGIQDCLSSCDRMARWNINVNTTCVLCQAGTETRKTIYFFHVGILIPSVGTTNEGTTWWWLPHGFEYHHNNRQKLKLWSDPALPHQVYFASSNPLHLAWEKYSRHGNDSSPPIKLEEFLDKTWRNRLSTILLHGNRAYADGLATWFGSRRNN